MNTNTQQITNIRFDFDGVQGFAATHGISGHLLVGAAFGLGGTYAEALDDALEMLAEYTGLDFGYHSELTDQIEKAFDRRASELDIDPQDGRLVDEVVQEMVKDSGLDEDAFWSQIDDIPQVGLVVRFDVEEVVA